MSPRWRIRVDVGGTFTDAVGRAPDGSVRRVKTPSDGTLRARVLERLDDRVVRLDDPVGPEGFLVGVRASCRPGRSGGAGFEPLGRVRSHGPDGAVSFDGAAPPMGAPVTLSPDEEAPIVAARRLTGARFADPLPPVDMRLATTRGTNAVLTRRTSRTALVATRGFRDLLRIGDQRRPDLFSLARGRPAPLAERAYEIDARAAADGSILARPNDAALDRLAAALRRDGIEAIAVALLHGAAAPDLEREIADALRARGFDPVVASHESGDRRRYLERAQTAVVDAALTPIFRRYLAAVRDALSGGTLQLLTSAGGLVDAERFAPRDGLLSGPAGGVVGARAAAERAGLDRALAFDMGGTSTDVSRIASERDYRFEHTVGDVTLVSPALAIETVAAGGGSICGFALGRLFVGPDSAGADPGPACYGAGGPFTLTDVHLLSGRLDPSGLGIPLDVDAARGRLDEALDAIAAATGRRPQPNDALADWCAIADETMADAVRAVSVRRGFDPSEHALVAFGGAGGLHVAALADRLGIDEGLVPPDAGILSAVGLDAATRESVRARSFEAPLDELPEPLDEILAGLETEALTELDDGGRVARRIARLRLAGQETPVDVDWDGRELLDAAFREEYRRIYGYAAPDRPIELESLRVFARGRGDDPPPPSLGERAGMKPGDTVRGPRALADAHGAIWVPDGWTVRLETGGALRMRRHVSRPPAAETARRTARLELFSHRFGAIAREMGEQLRRTAVSTNVKERLDFSCAVLDPRGRLVVNAPHIPVHLGALGLCVRRTMRSLALGPGDVVLVNHPGHGGSHLPDVTLVAPVFEEPDGGALLGFVANRAHHAEIGGTRPGSTPPGARTLIEEGVVFAPDFLVRGGKPRWERIERALTEARYPSRRPADNVADLRAALASIALGERALRRLARGHGGVEVRAQMEAILAHAGECMARALEHRVGAPREARVELDDGTPIVVRVARDGERTSIDFAGTAGVHPENWNATPAVVRGAVLYVLRLLVGVPLPLNEGLMRPIDLRIPRGLLNPEFGDDPAQAPAVVGGNTETSQRTVDALVEAFDLAADGQGTMNNVLFGDASFAYYETVGGGGGAGRDFAGVSATHVHMTNTAITDPETLENRFPVRLRRFERRRGSGGDGRRRGGDGLIREYEFLAPLELSVLAQRRAAGPRGAHGGKDGSAGTGVLVRRDGARTKLDGRAAVAVGAGDRFIMETPGGGGWGKPE